jgi:hypothetical protein
LLPLLTQASDFSTVISHPLLVFFFLRAIKMTGYSS